MKKEVKINFLRRIWGSKSRQMILLHPIAVLVTLNLEFRSLLSKNLLTRSQFLPLFKILTLSFWSSMRERGICIMCTCTFEYFMRAASVSSFLLPLNIPFRALKSSFHVSIYTCYDKTRLARYTCRQSWSTCKILNCRNSSRDFHKSWGDF